VFEDETSFRQDSTIHATWARRGQPPKVPITGARKSIKIFGCVDLLSAKFNYRVDEVFNANTYLKFLEQVARRYHGKHIFYIQDNASYHRDGDVWLWFRDHRKSIEVFNLPPYSPELNAIECLWKYTRKEGTHNRCFDSKAELHNSLLYVFKKIQRNPNSIRGYLHPFL